MKPTKFAIVGCGKVGVTLAWHLAALGYVPVGFASRRAASAHAAAEAAGGGRVCRQAWEATAEADLVFITTPDGAIVPAVEDLAAQGGLKSGAVVLHCSGVLPSTILSAVGGCGAHAGSLHPLQSFAAPAFPTNPFQGIVMAGEGEAAAMAVAREIAAGLGADFLSIRTGQKTLYHAAAVVASNYLVTLLSVAARLLEGSGIEPAAIRRVLLPLVRGTLGNIEKKGLAEALTGPIARGDIDTVSAHCAHIEKTLPDLRPLYGLLGLHTLPLAQAGSGLDADTARALAALLTSRADAGAAGGRRVGP
jgi:predicted short-subunit dehydrogenase-like oxidoreductase (DUF2520 family)